jgi:2-hydroxy-3-oxopropionate reductase
MTTTPAPVAFLGLGRMGLPMSLHLADAGFEVRAWNRSPRTPPSHPGFSLVTSAAEAGEDASVIVTMLPDIDEVRSVCSGPGGALSRARPGAIVVVMGTVSPVAVADWGRELAGDGFAVVDAPVSGGDVGAQEGTLSVMCGGDQGAVDTVRPLLEAMASSVRHLGPLGAGQLTKACNQVVVATTLAALAEAVTLARRGGLDVGQVLDVLGDGLAGSRALEVKRDKLVSGRYAPGGTAAFQHKDLGFALEAGRAEGVALPVTALVDQLFGSMRWTGHGEDDHSGVVRMIERLSGAD